jgi:proteasome lid subunit RPN8/RPN11
MDVIAQHVNSAWARKVGGILIGRPRNSSVTIQAAMPAEQVEEHGDEIAFLPLVWEQTYDVLIERYPGSRIVGWYHSHPGTGPILSDYDRRLHSVLFSEAPSVALVLDPVAQKSAWYGWVLGRLAPAGPAQRTAFVGGPARRGRAAVAAAIALGIAAAGAGGYWFGREREPSPVSTASAQLRARLRAEESQARQLGRRLAAAQTELTRAAAEKAAQEAELAATRSRLRQAVRSAQRDELVLRFHVQPGDTLWGLAQRLYGDPLEWKRIHRANARRLPDPNVLHVGQTILVPLP